MSALESIIRDAKVQYLAEFEPKVAALGYNLACGITRVSGSFAICANIYYSGTTADKVKSETNKILPSEYAYKGFLVPVDIRILEIPKKL